MALFDRISPSIRLGLSRRDLVRTTKDRFKEDSCQWTRRLAEVVSDVGGKDCENRFPVLHHSDDVHAESQLGSANGHSNSEKNR